MFKNIEILSLATDIARHSSARQSFVARNIANANTPGYQAYDIGAFKPTNSDFQMAMKATRPGHSGWADGNSASEPRPFKTFDSPKPNGNSVSTEQELVKAAELRNSHQMALSAYGTAMDILRGSLGRR